MTTLTFAKFVSPEYVAVIELLPTGKLEVVKLAAPPLNVSVPRGESPLANVTVPVGVTEFVDVGATVALRVILRP